MTFKNKLIPGTLRRRYKRFLADVVLEDGVTVTVYCPNTGSMRSCSTPGSRVYLSRAENPRRKYELTLEMVEVGGCWAGVNTGLTNMLVMNALRGGAIGEIGEILSLRGEVAVGRGVRLDLLAETPAGKVYIEVKNCSLVEQGVAMFPDAVTERGRRHLLALAELCRQGHQGIIFFLVQRSDARLFRPADEIDPLYGETLRQVCRQGVRILVYRALVEPQGIVVGDSLPWSLA